MHDARLGCYEMSNCRHCWAGQQWLPREEFSSQKVVCHAAVFSEYAKHSHPTARFAPLCEAEVRVYRRVLAKLADSVQKYRSALAQGFAAGGVVTISGKMDLFWALCRGGVEIRGRLEAGGTGD